MFASYSRTEHLLRAMQRQTILGRRANAARERGDGEEHRRLESKWEKMGDRVFELAAQAFPESLDKFDVASNVSLTPGSYEVSYGGGVQCLVNPPRLPGRVEVEARLRVSFAGDLVPWWQNLEVKDGSRWVSKGSALQFAFTDALVREEERRLDVAVKVYGRNRGAFEAI